MNILSLLWKAQRRLIGIPLGRLLFYQDRLDARGEPASLRRLGGLNQWVTERGITAPWMGTQAECQTLWKTITNAHRDVGNRPKAYAEKPQDIVNFLHRFWEGRVDRGDRILELGCNAGANLAGLLGLGYQNLNGIEINPNALAEMRESFPDLAAKGAFRNQSVEEGLRALPPQSMDVIFTMAVLIHIHPKSSFIFDEMRRAARKYVCVIETEASNNGYVFARNYRRVFEQRGLSQVSSTLITKENLPPPAGYDYYGYVARLFRIRS